MSSNFLYKTIKKTFSIGKSSLINRNKSNLTDKHIKSNKIKPILENDTRKILSDYTERVYSEYESSQSLENLIKKAPIIRKFDKRTVGQRNLTMKDKPIIPMTSPSEILYQKTENIYKYDTVQLLEALKSLSLTMENLPKMIFLLNIIRKKKELKHFESFELKKCVYFLIENKENLPFSYKISLFYSISLMNYFNNDKEIVYDLLNHIMTIVKTCKQENPIYNIRHLSNLAYAMSVYYKTNPIDFSFDSVFYDLEEIIIKYISNINQSFLCNAVDSQSFSNIILAYSKSQTGSEEFYQILSNISSYLNISSSYDLSIIVYSYSNNTNCNESILFSLLPNILSSIHKAKPCELVNFLRAYSNKGLLDEIPEVEKGVLTGFYSKYKQFNPLDLCYLYNILSEKYYLKTISSDDNEKKEGNQFFLMTHMIIKSLCSTFSGFELSILMQKSKVISEVEFDLYNQLCNQVRFLIDKKKIKGKELDLIHFHVKDVGYSTNNNGFNRIKEDIEGYLRKIKYYF